MTSWPECVTGSDQQPLPDEGVVTHAGVIRVLRVLGGMTWDDAMASENLLGMDQVRL